MSLTLTITDYQRLSPTQETSKTVEEDTISIGRAPQNDWVLEDPERILSGRHCIIQYRDGEYFITDTSTNGVFLNDSEERMERGQSVKLNDGDHLTIGDYEITARISSSGQYSDETDFEQQFTDIFPTSEAFSGGPPKGSPQADVLLNDPFAAPSSPGTAPSSEQILPEDSGLLGLGLSKPSPGQRATEPDHLSPEQELFQPPETAQEEEPSSEATPASREFISEPAPSKQQTIPEEENVIPEDWWQQEAELTPHEQAPLDVAPSPSPESEKPIPVPRPKKPVPDKIPAAAPPKQKKSVTEPKSPEVIPDKVTLPAKKDLSKPVPPPSPRESDGAALQAFLRGAGISHLRIAEDQPAQTMTNIGKIFRETVQGIMEILLARSSIKGEFRLDRTTLGPAENNPLKTPPGRPPLSVEETMALLLNAQERGFMPPVEAVRESFDDIKAHQLAVMAGIKTALTHLLERFNPDHLEERLGQQSMLDNIVPGKRKAKYWDSYKALYDQLAQEAEEDFNELFGKEFADAYEKQIRNL